MTLHSTWIGIVRSYAGGLIFLGFAVGLLATNGLNLITGGFLVLALVFVAVVLFDIPFATEFRRDGVTRRTALRHHVIPWERVKRIRRLRVGVVRTRRDGRGGGFVADVEGRNYVLVDTMECTVEFDDLRRLLGEQGDALGLSLDLRPPDECNPTWLYRRSKWKPDSARSG